MDSAVIQNLISTLEAGIQKAAEAGNLEMVDKLSQRLLQVWKESPDAMKLLTVDDYAKIFGQAKKTIGDWARDQEIESIKISGKRFFTPEMFQRDLKRRTVKIAMHNR